MRIPGRLRNKLKIYLERKQFFIGVVLVLIVLFIISLFYFRKTVNKVEKYFYIQFIEKIKSGLYSIDANLNENINYLIYQSSTSLTPIPRKAEPLNYIELKIGQILENCQFIKRILFLDYEKRKCTRLFPDRKVLNIPREIISFKGLNISKDRITKNLFYVYIPNTIDQKLDSLIWGLVVVPVKVKKRGREVTVGNVFFLFNVSEMVKSFIPEKELAAGYKFSLERLEILPEEVGLVRYVPWDNKYLKMSFDESSLNESSWRRFAKSTEHQFTYFFIAIWVTIFVGIGIISKLYLQSRRLQEKIYRKEKEDKLNMEALAKLMSDTASSGTEGTVFSKSLVTALSTITQSDKGLSFAIYDKMKRKFLHEYIGEEAEGVNFRELKDFPDENVLITADVKVSREEIYQIMLHDKSMEEDEDKRKYYESVLRIIDLGAEALAQRNLRQGMELKMFRTILKLLGSKDHYTCNHSLSMAAVAEFIASELVRERYGFTKIDIEAVKFAGYLHDIGKMGIPDEILNKQGIYSPEEMAIMIKHPLFTEIMLEPLAEISEFYDRVLNIAIRHHERGDGSGYPYGIVSEPEDPAKRREYLDRCFNRYRNDPVRQKRVCVFFEPIMQVLAVADVLDATLRDRPYKSALSDSEIKNILRGMKENGQIDGFIIDMTIREFEAIKDIRPDDKTDDCETIPSLPLEIIEKYLPIRGRTSKS